MKDYPDNIAWMIEVRDWPDDEEPVPTADRPTVPEWMKWVPGPPTAFGSGVVIKLEQLTPDDEPMRPAQIHNYLLTCGHVVRVGQSGFGPVAKEIVCWNPKYGYVRTKHRNAEVNEGRRKGQMEGGHGATVSPLSPYEGRAGAIPEGKDQPHLDWVLLKVENVEDRAAFDIEPSVSKVARPMPGEKTVVVGYPAGAGWATMASQWKAGAYLLQNGLPPQARRSGEHGIAEVAHGLLSYHEAVDARPGMSGGGVFRATDQALVGIHRSRDDAALHAQAVCVADILEWLRMHRHMRLVVSAGMEPVPTPASIPEPKTHWLTWVAGARTRWLTCVAGALVLLVGVVAHYLWKKPEYAWRGYVRERVVTDGTVSFVPVDGAEVIPHSNGADNTEIKVTTPSPAGLGPGEFQIITSDSGYHSFATQLKIMKEGYVTLLEPAPAVEQDPDGAFRRKIYTLKKQTTP